MAAGFHVVGAGIAAPSGIAIIGPGETAETFCRHYCDSRGVAGICQMSLDDGGWKLWRQASGFWQCYTGCSPARARRSGAPGEGSAEGPQWKRGFGLNYVRPG